jgi:hypothetical protein
VANAQLVLSEVKAKNALPRNITANVFRGVQQCAPGTPLAAAAKEVLTPAELYGGRWSFRWVSGLAIILVVVFGLIYGSDRARGGYKAVHISA